MFFFANQLSLAKIAKNCVSQECSTIRYYYFFTQTIIILSVTTFKTVGIVETTPPPPPISLPAEIAANRLRVTLDNYNKDNASSLSSSLSDNSGDTASFNNSSLKMQ